MTATSADWRSRDERGSAWLIRFMARLSLRIGRAPARLLLYPIAGYFFATSTAARQRSLEFLRRALGREPTWRERFAHFLAFSTTLHDRVFFVAGRFEPFDIRVTGIEALRAHSGGLFLMGGHLGSFEAIRASGHGHIDRPVVLAMFEDNARKLHAVLSAINPQALDGIVALGHLDSMLKLNDALERDAYVGVLADRTPGGQRTTLLPFLGAPAAFATGPMRMAAALRRPVVFMAGLYQGGNRYEVRFEPIADFSTVAEGDRPALERLTKAAIERYAACLERHARAAPFNWFNFHDFWAPPAG